jgi:drug/metabolite transporter (DMT)-like permease
MEATFTVLLAALILRERIGIRVTIAAGFMVVAGLLLTLGGGQRAVLDTLGVIAIVGATLAWALDNTLTRPLSEQDPLSVVLAKGALGAAATAGLAIALKQEWPNAGRAVVLLACGATGYGLSLRLYLLAQRRIGAARTGSIFALAPFIGAAIAWPLTDHTNGALTLVSAFLFALGVLLHVTEHHDHRHRHDVLEHEHAHAHDDGHHDHTHVPPVSGEHTHRHRHETVEHDHPHAPDIHHAHEHTVGRPGDRSRH